MLKLGKHMRVLAGDRQTGGSLGKQNDLLLDGKGYWTALDLRSRTRRRVGLVVLLQATDVWYREFQVFL